MSFQQSSRPNFQNEGLFKGRFSSAAYPRVVSPERKPALGSGDVQVIEGLLSAAAKCGARFRFAAPVTAIETEGSRVTGVCLAGGEFVAADIVVSNRCPVASPLYTNFPLHY